MQTKTKILAKEVEAEVPIDLGSLPDVISGKSATCFYIISGV